MSCIASRRENDGLSLGQGGEIPFLAAYLDASNALREDPELEKQV